MSIYYKQFWTREEELLAVAELIQQFKKKILN